MMKSIFSIKFIVVSLTTLFTTFSYAGTVTPSASFGVATHVVVGQNGNTSVVFAKNAKGDVFFGKAQYVPDKGTYYGKMETNVHVKSATNGAVSNGTVKATIEHKVPKRPVTDAILDKARTAGKSLGKGAATLGRTAVKRHPWGLAFALALEGLAGSDFFWHDEKGDFVREKDDNTYIVFATYNPLVVAGATMDEAGYKRFCDDNAKCAFITYTKSLESAVSAGNQFCQSVTLGNGKKATGYGGPQSRCEGYNYTTDVRIQISKWRDYVPITPDEFFDESEPDADKNPNEWVETSGVKPTDDPSVSVPAGTVAQTSPYTDPQDGKTKQTRWDFEPNGRVRETVIPRPDLVPDSPEAPRLDPPSEEDTPNGDKDKDKEGENEKDKEKAETEDLCEKNPDIMACDKQPEKPDEQDFEIEHETVNVFFAPDTIFPTTGTCPAPVSFRVDIPFAGAKTFEFDTAPACEIARRLRDLLIAIAWLVTAVFCFRSFSLKGS